MFGINFLRSFFNFHAEKPEVAMARFGVFITSSHNNDEVIIDKCRALLQNIQSDTKIVYAHRDVVHKGLKVFFNCGSDIPELLKKKLLSASDDAIHSLTTALMVHNAFPSNEEEFKEAIRNQIKNSISVQVLDIIKVPFSLKNKDVGSGKWIIILDIPEVDELNEFKMMGLPNMVLKLPCNDECLSVKFYCRLCQKDGHVQYRCLASDITTHSAPTVSPNIANASNVPEAIFSQEAAVNLPATSNSGASSNDFQTHFSRTLKDTPAPSTGKVLSSRFRIRNLDEERAESAKKPLNIYQSFMSEIGKEQVRRYCSGNDNVKIEKGEQIPSPLIDLRDLRAAGESSANRTGDASYRASSTTTDSVEINFDSSISHIQNPPDNSPVVTTTHNQASVIKREAPASTDEDEDSSAPTPKRPKKTLRMLPVVIPDGIREIISGMPAGVLDVGQLEAFFNHVKKKSRPAELATTYTDDVEGLHAQLVAISTKYYMSPKVGSNEDIKFMKMLKNILQRFFNTQQKRTGNAQR